MLYTLTRFLEIYLYKETGFFFFFPAMCEIKNWSPLSTHPGRADEVGEGMLPHGVPPGGTEHSRAPFAA